jgi:tetratricopeptide (TPR) repeat protein
MTQSPPQPRDVEELARIRALWGAGDAAAAEAQLRRMLARQPQCATAELLAQVLRSQGRMNAAAATMETSAALRAGDHLGLLRDAQFIRECQRQDLALALCERELGRDSSDPQLHALSGNLAQELGRFETAQRHYRAAIAHGVDMNVWFVLHSLAATQHFQDRGHPDLELLRTYAADRALTPRARAAVLFGLGKASDDVGDYAAAARAWREANALLQSLGNWSRARWDAWTKVRLTAVTLPPRVAPADDPRPIFIVGLPRTGTTLVAQWLGRHPQVCNRGELPVLRFLAEGLATLDIHQQGAAVEQAAAIYLAHMRRDDPPVACYVDKNPLNLRYLDAVAAMFPQARIIHCRRSPRDAALSIWSQSFAGDEYGFATAFADIAAFAAGCDTLLTHWRRTLPLHMCTVDYEQFVSDPRAQTDSLLSWLGLAPMDWAHVADPAQPITSASQWQARQSVHTRSVGRWRHYADHLPELVRHFPQ